MVDYDYYDILEIERGNDKSQIKKAYRRLALKYHPDRNKGDKESENKFKLINEAYQVLSDPQKKSIYDKYGKDGLDRQGFRHFSDFAYSDVFEDLNSIFDSVFGGGFGGKNKRKKHQYSYNIDIETEITLSFKEAVFGTKKDINIAYKKACLQCKGTGSKDAQENICPQCNGSGNVVSQHSFISFSQTCPRCNGKGVVIKQKCEFCSGLGYKKHKDTVELEIPEGIDNQNTMRVLNKGNVYDENKRGSLYVNIHIKNDKYFIRDNSDIYVEVPVFFTQALLGSQIEVPTIRGSEILKLTVGTLDKQRFILKHKGIKDVNSNKIGNQIVQIKIVAPKKVNDKQRDLLIQLQESFQKQHKSAKEKLEESIKRVKGWFKS